ncbi:MAG: sulfite exporter TauE/SafE family protein [Cumulibacter sp.]
MSLWAIIAITGTAIFLGSIVQGLIGLGVGLVAAPVLVLVDPHLMPGAMILCGAVLPIMTLVREHDNVDWRGLAWAFPWRIIGSVIGGWLIAVASPDSLSIMVGVFVLVAVSLSMLSWRPRPSPVTLSIGALTSGIGGTATSIGGPPIALVYQHQHPSMLRSTLAVFFFASSTISLLTLAIYGELGWYQIRAGLLLLPFVFLGFLCSLWVRRHLDPEKVRPAVLLVSAVSSVILIIRALL